MKIIKLYGHLGKKFGKIHKYNVRTPAEAIRALCANFPEFKQYMLQYSSPGYHVISGREDCVETLEKLNYPVSDSIKLIPAITGAGGSGSGWISVVLGVALIWATGGFASLGLGSGFAGAGGAFAAGGSLAGMTGFVSAMGAALLVSGVSQLLFSGPKQGSMQTAAEVEQNASAYFNGPQNVSVQGNPVPLIYGRLLVGSQIVSAEFIASKYLVAPVAKTLGTEVWLNDTMTIGKDSVIQLDPYKKGTLTTDNAASDKFSSPVLHTGITTNLLYIRAGISGTDLDGKVVGFKIKVPTSVGTLKIENADGSATNIVTNTQYASRTIDTTTEFNDPAVTAFRSLFSSAFYKNKDSATGAIIRWYPPSGIWRGTVNFIYVMVDDDGVESAPLTVNMGYTG